jgi:DNA-binding NarL/FixJ family response regulator
MKKLFVTLVSHPGAWQRVLQKIVEGYPFVKRVDVASGSLTAFEMVKQQYTDIMVIDSSLPFDDLIALVQRVKKDNPGIRLIVIADTVKHQQRVIRAGADYTLSSVNFEDKFGEILSELVEIIPLKDLGDGLV